jgi:hypothetical protein
MFRVCSIFCCSLCVSHTEESGLCLEKENSIFLSVYADNILVVGKLKLSLLLHGNISKENNV